jgi:hypothetical protein
MKVWNYFYIGLTMLILFIVFGILPIPDGGFLNWVGISQVGGDFTFSFAAMSLLFKTILAGAVAAGIAIGFITKSKSENYVLIPIVLVLTGLVGTFVSILSAASGYPSFIKTILSIILVPFIAGYLLALAEWFRGTD